MSKKTFEDNGGYFIDGVAYMDCKITGQPVKNDLRRTLNQHTNLQVVPLVGIGWLSL